MSTTMRSNELSLADDAPKKKKKKTKTKKITTQQQQQPLATAPSQRERRDAMTTTTKKRRKTDEALSHQPDHDAPPAKANKAKKSAASDDPPPRSAEDDKTSKKKKKTVRIREPTETQNPTQKTEKKRATEVDETPIRWADFADSLDLDRRLTKAIADAKWTRPTLVQRAAIPVALNGRDVLVQARTGSGKTACYAVPVLNRILKFKTEQIGRMKPDAFGVLAIALAPTRELVAQARRHLDTLASYCLDEIAVVAFAGEDADADARAVVSRRAALFSGCDIVVATPAALREAIDHVVAAGKGGQSFVGGVLTSSSSSEQQQRRQHPLSRLRDTLRFLVVDEADLVLSFGYDDDVRAILARVGLLSTTVQNEPGDGVLPKNTAYQTPSQKNYYRCQCYLLSATLTEDVAALKKVALRRAATIRLRERAGVFGGERDDEHGLAQYFVPIRKDRKEDKFLVAYVMLKLALLEGRGILFVNDLDSCYRLKLFLDMFSIRTVVLNAELPLASRLHAIEVYNKGYYDLLVATDAAVTACGGDFGGSEDDDEEEEDEEDDDENSQKNKRKRKRGRKKDALSERPADEAYGVARGIDFQNVRWVLNVDFPKTPASYTHRVGRTARAGAKGTAVSLVRMDDATDIAALKAVQSDQPPVSLASLAAGGACAVVDALGFEASRTRDHQSAFPDEEDLSRRSSPTVSTHTTPNDTSNRGAGAVVPQPAELAFDASSCEPFRYRVDDVRRGVTRAAVAEARAAELRREILNSKQLRAHFEANPNDLAVLSHDRAQLHVHRQLVQDAVKTVPSYLVPKALAAAGARPKASFKRKKKNISDAQARASAHRGRRVDNDPLHTFDASGVVKSATTTHSSRDDDDKPEEPPAKKPKLAPAAAPKIYASAADPELRGAHNAPTSNRAKWKMRHKKGEWNPNPKRRNKKYSRGDTQAFGRKKF